MRVSVIETRADCARLREPWNRIVGGNASAPLGFDVTATYEWTMTLCDNFVPGKPLVVLVLEDAGEVVGILPCYFRAHEARPAPWRALSAISNLNCGRCGFLVEGDSPERLGFLLRFLTHEIKGWATFRFTLVNGGPSAAAFERVASTMPHRIVPEGGQTSPYIQLPADAAALIDSRDKRFKSNLRYSENRLRKLGQLCYRTYSDPAEAGAFLEIALTIERGSWKEQAGTSITTNPLEESFYRRFTPVAAERGWLLGQVLFLEDRPIAYVYGIQFGEVYSDFKESYLEEFKAMSPGQVLKTMCFAELARRGMRGYDFMGNSEPYKMKWTDETYTRTSYLMFNTSIAGKWTWFRRNAARYIRDARKDGGRESGPAAETQS